MATYELSDLTVNIDFESHIDGDKTKPVLQYQATVMFSSLEKLLERGGESVKRTLQTKARDGKFPTGRRVTVDEDGKFAKTAEEKAAEAFASIAALNPENEEDEAQLEKLFELYQAKKAAKLAAEKAAKAKK